MEKGVSNYISYSCGMPLPHPSFQFDVFLSFFYFCVILLFVFFSFLVCLQSVLYFLKMAIMTVELMAAAVDVDLNKNEH